MRRVFVFIAAFIVLVSCGKKVIEAPENLISEKEMALILYDVTILNSAKGINPGFLGENNIELMPFIFKKYKIDSLQFVQSNVYYASVPLKYQTIYEAVQERLEKEIGLLDQKRLQKNDSSRKAGERRRDSLKIPIKKAAKDSLLKK